MSRIGKKIIALSNGVEANITEGRISIKGPKGELSRELHSEIVVLEKENEDGGKYLEVELADGSENKAIWGTMRAHLANMVQGVTEGWSKTLELSGVGFRMNLAGKTLKMNLGFSHEVNYDIPEGIDANIEGMTLTISGLDKELVGKVASEIRAFKKPEPYKGKGFRYSDEVIRRKVGKAAKAE